MCWHKRLTDRSLTVPGGRLIALASLLVGLAVSPPAQAESGSAPAPSERAFLVRFENRLLTVRAESLPLTVVLREIERLTGVEFEVDGSITSTVSANFADVPLEEGVTRLVRSHGVVMIYAGTGARKPGLASPALAKVLVFPEGTAPARGLQDREQTAAVKGPARALPQTGTRNEIIRSLVGVLYPQNPTAAPKDLEALTDQLDIDDLKALVQLLNDQSVPVEELSAALAEAAQAMKAR